MRENNSKLEDLTVYSRVINDKTIDSREIIVWFRDKESFDTKKYFWCNVHMAAKLGISREDSGLVLSKDYYDTFVLDEEGNEMIDKLHEASLLIKNDSTLSKTNYVVKLQNSITEEIYYIDFILEVFERYPDGSIKSWGGNGIDISSEYKKNKAIKYLASNDDVTGISNRRFMFENINKLWKQSIRAEKSVSFIMIDIDNFKEYNDFYGHVKGDHVLKQIGSVLKESAKRPLDIVGRYGGEEFLVVLPDTELNGAKKVAEVIRKKVIGLRIKHQKNPIEKYITVCLGVHSVIPDKDTRVEQAVSKADKAMYKAKQLGKNRVEIA